MKKTSVWVAKRAISKLQLLEQVMGYSPEEVLNTYARQYWVHPEQRDQLVREIQDKDAVRGKEILLRKKGGSTLWASVNAKQLKDDQGNFMGAEVMLRDVTKKKQAEELMLTQRDLSIALSSICDFKKALEICLDTALKLEEVDGGAIYLIDSNSGCLDLVVHRNLSTDFVNAVSHLDKESLQVKLVSKGESIFQPYAKMASSFSYSCGANRKIVHSAGIRALAVIPMSDDGKIFGCLVVSSTATDQLSSFSRYCLETVAGQMAAALSRIKIDQYLRSSRHNLKTLFESIDDFLFILDDTGRIIKTNPAVESRLGYASDELIGMDVTQVYPQNSQNGSHAAVRQTPISSATFHPNSIMRPDDHLMPRAGQAIPVETKINQGIWDGKPAFFAISRDITLRLKAEEAKRISEERLMAAIDAIDEGFVIFDKNDRLVMCNNKFLDIYKVSADMIKPGAKFEDFIRKGAYRGQYLDAEGDVENWVTEQMVTHRCGGENFEQRIYGDRWIRIAERKMEDGSMVGFRVDVTDIKRSEDLLRNALMEKEILLKEIHHRVKNNLAVISSMLNLQIKNNANKVVQESLKESRSRVRSMALIHETLHQANNLSAVRLRDYISKLIRDLLSVYEHFSDQFSIEYDIEDVYLDINQAVYCGIIINELVTNSLKYAFADNERGIIRISAKTQPNHEIELSVKDNGAGLPPGFNWEKTRTLGMRLISLMVEQLHGSMKASHQGGLKTVIRWKSSLQKEQCHD
ncbi:PAS domain S-box protein [Desulfosarcina ovata]|nr:PAS domain S-box protein [Desulfosarcina ovata]